MGFMGDGGASGVFRWVGRCSLAVSMLMVVGLLCVGVGVAFGGVGFVAAGGFAGPAEGFHPVGVAVNNTAGGFAGDVYAGDFSNGAVDRFSATGTWEKVTGSIPGFQPYQITVDQNAGEHEGDVFAAGNTNGVVYRFSPGLVLEEEITGLEAPHGVTVNTAEDLFVSEANGTVHEFNSAGKPVDASGALNPSNTVIEGIPGTEAIVAEGAGDLYIATDGGTFHYKLNEGAYQQVNTLDPSQATGVALDTAGNVLTDLQTQFLDYTPAGTLLAHGGAGTLQGGFGVAVNTKTSDVYVADLGTGLVEVFETGSTPQAPATESAQADGVTSFTLHGTLAGETTGYYFAYNTGGSCEGGQSTPAEEATSGAVQAEVTGLAFATQYDFCLVATNKFGVTVGPALTFKTGSIPPEITGQGFSNVTDHAARVAATVSPQGLPGRYHYEYSTSPLSESQPKATSETSYTANGPLAATAELEGLEPNTKYYYRAVATNTSKETEVGPEETLTTLPPATNTLPDNRVYEMVSPPRQPKRRRTRTTSD